MRLPAPHRCTSLADLGTDSPTVRLHSVGAPVLLLAASAGTWALLIAGVVVGLIIAWGLGRLFARRRTARSLAAMRQAAERLSDGDLTVRLPEAGIHPEAAALSRAINAMSTKLDRQLDDLRSAEQRQNAVLDSMVEGTVAVDQDDRVIVLNGAAADLLGVDREQAIGRSIFEAIRHAGIQRFLVRILHHKHNDPLVEDVVLHEGGTRYFQAVGTPLRNRASKVLGAVMVLHDVTRLHRLESAQRDFVANVSHELRTPVTSIQGFAETLLDSDLDDEDTSRRFLAIMIEQAERLKALINDLLRLSRVEGEADAGTLQLKRTQLRPVVENVVKRVRNRTETHTIEIEAPDGSRPIYAWLDDGLFEQAIANLLDNAIKYSPNGSVVLVRIIPQEREVEIQVEDEGVGISPENRTRVFDRFYRVDKSRGRRIGGTGLGLPIVKHIVRAHAGRIELDSELGKGSTFRIFLPNQVRMAPTRISQALYSVHARLNTGEESSSAADTERPSARLWVARDARRMPLPPPPSVGQPELPQHPATAADRDEDARSLTESERLRRHG